ncbi:MAG: glycosyltransferase [Hyphomicrobiaceae bacterium]
MRVLFIHQNFPGQFRSVAGALMADGTDVAVITDAQNKRPLKGPVVARYQFTPKGPEGLTAAAATVLQRFQRGESAAKAMLALRQRGFVPDVIIGHPGWGEMLLANAVYPKSRIIAHAEFYYSAEGADVGFDPEFLDVTDELRMRLAAKNMPLLSALADCSQAVSPTHWQASRCPPEFAGKIRIIHEGIRTDTVRPDPKASFEVPGGNHTFRAGDELITFVNRNLEPMRGFHVFLRTLPEILKARPNAHVVIVGADGVSYGSAPPPGRTWKGIYLAEVGDKLPRNRVHFVGQIPYAQFIALMQVSRLHIYATYPFVLSWSMLEAMSAEALVLGSATPPVAEIIEHGVNGLLYDFFDTKTLAEQAIAALAEPQKYEHLRKAARQTIVERYDMAKVCLPAWLQVIRDVEAMPPPSAR